jgi:outer membrane usher protein FimD/PapC
VALVKVSACATKGGPVFVELMLLLAGRKVLITVAKVDGGPLPIGASLWRRIGGRYKSEKTRA